MKKSLKNLIEDLEQYKKIPKEAKIDFERVSKFLSLHHVNLKSSSLKRLWKYMTTAEKPRKSTLDRLSIFAGFQDWNELQRTFKGE